MIYREITAEEIVEINTARADLERCIQALADHHNRISMYHTGMYPLNPPSQTVRRFYDEMKRGESRLYACFDGQCMVGFCKIDIHGQEGKLDYLYVDCAYRKQGIGAGLMDWAMEMFRVSGVEKTEVKVVAGNDALAFYERYGFRMKSYILCRTEEDNNR